MLNDDVRGSLCGLKAAAGSKQRWQNWITSQTLDRQIKWVRLLVATRDGLNWVVGWIDNGVVPLIVLRDAQIVNTASATADSKTQARLDGWLSALPDVDAAAEARLQKWISLASGAVDTKSASDSIARGQKVWKQHCAVCHRIGETGERIGPNLDGLGTRGVACIAEDIVFPSRRVDEAFRSTVLVTDEGRVLTGWVREGDAGTIKITDSRGETKTLDPESIERRKRLRTSPMPSGLDETIGAGGMADLLRYLGGLRQ
ncbi:MAG: c-type cytochrome [Planctomycetota bacterium]